MCVELAKNAVRFLHGMAIVFIDFKETIIFMVLHSLQICKTKYFQIFSEDDNIEDSSVVGSQSFVCITDAFTFTTSATTTTATPGPVVATFSSSVSFPVATPAQESVAGPSCSFSGGSFYSTRQRTPVLAKRAQVEPPKKTPEITSKESCGKDGKNKDPGGEEG